MSIWFRMAVDFPNIGTATDKIAGIINSGLSTQEAMAQANEAVNIAFNEGRKFERANPHLKTGDEIEKEYA